MIILEKWLDLPMSYNILFPTSAKISTADFFELIDALYSDSIIVDEIDCVDDTDDIIDCGNTEGGDDASEMNFVIVNSSTYNAYTFTVTPIKSTIIYTQFDLELTTDIECGEYQAFLAVDNNTVATTRLRIVPQFTDYNEYNPNRDIYERD